MRKLYLLLIIQCFFVLSVTAQCPTIVGIMVDACINPADPTSQEQDNEFIFLRNGASPLAVNDLAIDLPNNTDITIAGTNDFAPNAGTVASPIGGCFTVLDDGGTIPANAAVVIFMSNDVNLAYDFTSWCTQFGNVYILYKNQAPTTPTYLNTSPSAATRNTIVSTTTCPAVTFTYNVPTTSADGNFYGFPAPTGSVSISPGPANNGCTSPPFNPLPVTLMNFTAGYINNNVVLTWNTATEINASHFTIEKSTDGISFSPVTQVPAAGNSSEELSYRYVDSSPGTGTTYYRLRMVDLDGQFKLSRIVIVNATASGIAFNRLYPNPVSVELIIEWNARGNSQAQVTVIDLNGRIMGTQLLSSVPGFNQGKIPVAELAPGQYILRMSIDGELITEKFLKQ